MQRNCSRLPWRIGLLLLLLPAGAGASPLGWTLEGISAAGQPLSGLLFYDADTGDMLAWNISYGGSLIWRKPGIPCPPDFPRCPINTFSGTAGTFTFAEGVPIALNVVELVLKLTRPLTGEGGAVPLSSGMPDGSGSAIFAPSGAVIPVSGVLYTPEPDAVLPTAAGLLLLVFAAVFRGPRIRSWRRIPPAGDCSPR
jgi:hypothetical protein